MLGNTDSHNHHIKPLSSVILLRLKAVRAPQLAISLSDDYWHCFPLVI